MRLSVRHPSRFFAGVRRPGNPPQHLRAEEFTHTFKTCGFVTSKTANRPYIRPARAFIGLPLRRALKD